MEKPYLKDPNEYPNDEVLGKLLGDVKDTWFEFFDYLNKEYPEFKGEWRYYKDGQSWLYKLVKKKKTICWLTVYPNKFETTFYFPDRAEEVICNSTLSPVYIDKFVTGKRYGKTRGLTIAICELADLEHTKILIDIKEKLK